MYYFGTYCALMGHWCIEGLTNHAKMNQRKNSVFIDRVVLSGMLLYMSSVVN